MSENKPKPTNGKPVKQAFLKDATTFPGVASSITNLHDTQQKGRQLTMTAIDSGLSVVMTNGTGTPDYFFVPYSNIKSLHFT